MNGVSRISLNQPLVDSFFDEIEIDPSGLIRVIGWSKGQVSPKITPAISLDGHPIPLLQSYRTSRPDVERVEKISVRHAGMALEYLLPEPLYGRAFQSISISIKPHFDRTFGFSTTFVSPEYRPLFSTAEVCHRQKIYGSGPPNLELHPEVMNLARQLPGPVLDFGCGSGVLVAALQASGTPSKGLEVLDASRILPHVRDSIMLYDGRFPSPIPSRSARSVFCSEVLEHIPDYEAAVKDIARIATERVIITVPDCSAIPLGARHGLVPWHLLESTHVNFFNQASLEAILRPHFSSVEFGRICACPLNDSTFHVSLAAFCTK